MEVRNIESTAAAVSLESLEGRLRELMTLEDERHIDPRWSRALETLRPFVLRPAKRVRPMLVLAGYQLMHRGAPPEGVVTFAAGLELLHTFMLVHDDVADRAPSRRGGPALHHLLGTEQVGAPRLGDDLAIVAGDHLYALAVESMLGVELPAAAAATRYLMGICRHTAAGQFLDLELAGTPLGDVSLFQTIKVANLKTARYGFVAPLVAGAMLGGAEAPLLEALERVGRQAGLAFQLRDDVIGLFGDERTAGKDGGADFLEGKRTFPVIAAWTRADAAGRAELEAMWASPRPASQLEAARALVRTWGGDQAAERVIARMTRGARRSVGALPEGSARRTIDGFLARLERRVV